MVFRKITGSGRQEKSPDSVGSGKGCRVVCILDHSRRIPVQHSESVQSGHRKLKENPGINAGGASLRLAVLSPRELARLIKQSFTFYSPSDRDWRMLFAEAKRDRIRLLADELGLVFEIEEVPGWINS